MNKVQRAGEIEHVCEVGVGKCLYFNCCNRDKHAISNDLTSERG